MAYIKNKGKLLRKAESELSAAPTKDKNLAIAKVCESLEDNRRNILEANLLDVENAERGGMSSGLVDRLKLDDGRLDDIIDALRQIIGLQEPVWKSDQVWTLENGLTISKMTVPLGVIGIIYESRPNVTVDAFGLALKSGNCILLRGSSSAVNSNTALVKAIREGLRKSPISEEVIQFIERTDREYVLEMLEADGYIDLIIPRGGQGLIDFVIKNASVPTLQTGAGNCHIFIDESADLAKTLNIIKNAKLQRVGVCNACETLLIHEGIADRILPSIYEELKDDVDLRGCHRTAKIIEVNRATESDWEEEFLDYILAIRIVRDMEEAIEHIQTYSTKHSEAIITENLANSRIFLRRVDSATVYLNASTRFTDGGVFGFGAEMGISTQKMHARGPVGLEQLVTHKYLVLGEGQIRD